VDAGENTGGDQGQKRSKELVTKYFRGKKAIVYYDPRNPRLAVLKRGIKLGGVLLFEAFIGFIACPGLIIMLKLTNEYRNDSFIPYIVIGLFLGFISVFFLKRVIDKDDYRKLSG
jgi:hypothetical protein